MQHACGSALVCDTMEVARDICYNKGIEVKGELSCREPVTEWQLADVF